MSLLIIYWTEDLLSLFFLSISWKNISSSFSVYKIYSRYFQKNIVQLLCVSYTGQSLYNATFGIHRIELFYKWATSNEKNLFMPCANNKGADQPAQPLANFCSWADRFEAYLGGNPEDRFSHDVAQINCVYKRTILQRNNLKKTFLSQNVSVISKILLCWLVL